MLQRYSDVLSYDLARSFPHRVRGCSHAGPLAGPAGEPVCEGSTVRWTEKSRDVDFWSTGVGLVTATYRLDMPDSLAWDAVGRDVEAARHVLKDGLQSLRDAAVAEVRRAVSRGELAGREFLDAMRPGRHAQALWTHVTFLLEGTRPSSLEDIDRLAKLLTWGGAPEPRSFELEPLAVRVSLDSAVGYHAGDESVAVCVPRLIGVHTVIWAALTDLDRRLLRADPGMQRATSLRGLEGEMDRTMDTFDHARRLRAAVESVSVHLSGLDRALWEVLAETWGLATPLRTIDVKLESEQHVLAHAMASLSNRRAHVLGTLALLFSVASIVGVVGGLVDLSAKRLRLPTGPNLWLVAGLVAVVIASGLLLWSLVLRSAERVRQRAE